MDDPFATVDLDNLALATLKGATDDLDLIIFSHGHGSNVVFGSEHVEIGALMRTRLILDGVVK